jgi:rod shape-determining protein MreC|tara:strand:+ start:413 stop:1255 length:843 start_codon:yes stop_codon:yes gene_type:complete
METNRDDFIIAIRSAFLKKGNRQRFSLTTLIIISIIILIFEKYNFKAINLLKTSLKEIVYRSTFIVSVPENLVKNAYKLSLEHINLYEDYKKLNLEYKKLKAENLNIEFIKSENKILKSKIEDIKDQKYEVLAKVIIDKQSPFLKSLIVNRGSKDKIELGMAVLDGDFLVGKVVEVNYLTSRILLLSDLNSKIPVSIEPNGIQSILSGTGGKHGKLQYLLSDNLNIKGEDEVFTSGSGNIFNAGIPVGTVKIKDNLPEIIFHSDFSQLRLVKIVTFESKE